MATKLRQGPPGLTGGLCGTTPFPMYLGASPRPGPTTALFIYSILQPLYTSTNLQMWGLCSPHTPPSQSSSTSDSLACTLTAISLSDHGSRGVKCPGAQPSAVVSESDHGSLKARCSSSSMIDPHSCDCCHLLGLPSCSISPCLSSTPPDGSSGPASPCSSSSSCPYSSSCSSSSSSIEEESSGQLMRWWALSLMMRATSWETHGT